MSIDEKSLKNLLRGSSVRRGRGGVSGNADKCLVHTEWRGGVKPVIKCAKRLSEKTAFLWGDMTPELPYFVGLA